MYLTVDPRLLVLIPNTGSFYFWNAKLEGFADDKQGVALAQRHLPECEAIGREGLHKPRACSSSQEIKASQ